MSNIPKGRNRHHIRPRSRHGRNSVQNLLLIEIEKHRAYHFLFGNRTLEEAIELLRRIDVAKKKQTTRSY